MARTNVSPLDWKTPIVDPKTGTPSLQFVQLWQQLFGNEDGTNATATTAATTAAAAVPQTRKINTTGPIAGGGDLSADLTLTHATSGVAAATYGDSTHVPQFVVDNKGHIQSVVLVPIAIAAGSATVSTGEATASTTYVDLATAGPSVTLTTGTSALVTISGHVTKALGGLGNDGFLALEVSGATTIAAADANAASQSYPLASGGFNFQIARTFKITGLTPGSNTFKLKYRCNGGNAWTFFDRDITVIAL